MTQAKRSQQSGSETRDAHRSRSFWIGIARAFGGAIFFSLPLLMTMEMWQLGFSMRRVPLVLFMLVIFPMLVGLDRVSGFRPTDSWLDDAIDASVAYGVGFVAAAGTLALFNIVNAGMEPHELVGKIALQAIPAAFGAVLSASQLGAPEQGGERGPRAHTGYGWELFLMSVGAVFFAFNVAPTEEMILIAYRMSSWHAVGLLLATLLAMHGFVYAVNFRGTEPSNPGTSIWSLFARFTAPGYAISLLVSGYVLWSFGRFESASPPMILMDVVVLAFPAGLGAAAARLII